MSDWKISNRSRPVSYKQFRKLTLQFQRAAKKGLDADVSMTIIMVKQGKALLLANDFNNATQQTWHEADLVRISLSARNNPRGLALATFDRDHPRTAEFSIQGEVVEDMAFKTMRATCRRQLLKIFRV